MKSFVIFHLPQSDEIVIVCWTFLLLIQVTQEDLTTSPGDENLGQISFLETTRDFVRSLNDFVRSLSDTRLCKIFECRQEMRTPFVLPGANKRLKRAVHEKRQPFDMSCHKRIQVRGPRCLVPTCGQMIVFFTGPEFGAILPGTLHEI